jgi:hypothetical protein
VQNSGNIPWTRVDSEHRFAFFVVARIVCLTRIAFRQNIIAILAKK